MQPPTPPSPPASVRLLALALVALGASSGARTAPLDALSEAARDAVVSACLPVQYDEGAEAYRACVEREVGARADREPGALELLELDERYAVERRCGEARERSEIAWFDCIDAELASLASAPAPGLAGLREDERHALLRDCFDEQSNAGVAAWRGCMSRTADELRAVPQADLSALDVVGRNALQAGCADEDDAPGYRRCLLERGAAAGVAARPDDAPSRTPADPDGALEAATRVVGGGPPSSRPQERALGRPAPEPPPPSLGAAAPGAGPPGRVSRATAQTDGSASDPASGPVRVGAQADPAADVAPADALEGPAADGNPIEDAASDIAEPGIAARVARTYGSLDETGRWLLWGALALPLLLLASSALLRRRGPAGSRGGRTATAGPGLDEPSLADRIGPTRGRPVAGRTLHFDALDTGAGGGGAGRADAAAAPAAAAVTPPGQTARVRDRLNDEADDLFDALDRDLDAEDDPDGDLTDGSGTFDPRDDRAELDALAVSLDASDATSRRRTDAASVRDAGSLRPAADAADTARDTDGFHGDEDLDATAARDAPSGPDRDAPTLLVSSPLRRTPDREPAHDPAHDSALDLAHGDAPGTARDAADGRGRGAGPPVGPGATRARPASAGFGVWLASRLDEDRRSLAVEFLIYWMAWGDERYEPATRDAVFADPDPDDSTTVKRRVLEEDVTAFADTVRWLVLNTSRETRSQILELLVALLVTDPVPTPVQNTLLRFLADAFGLGVQTLESQFDRAFEAPLPPLPRVDRSDWWAVQDEAGMVRREGRTLAKAPAGVRHRARLGLPLDGPLDGDEVLAAFELASRRAAPERFDALGERERTLAARQLDRFADGRDALLEELGS